MSNSIHPCLWFDGQAKEAATFYCSIFPNSKITMDTPMVVNFEINGKKFMGLNGGPMFKINPSISIFVYCKTADETDEIYNRLAEGGEPLMAIGKYDWSERYGWIKDKYGLTWQVMLSPEEKICPSLLFTGDKFGKAEEAINFYTSVFSAGPPQGSVSGGYNSAVNAMHHYTNESAFAGKVLFADFDLNQYNMTAMDGSGDHAYTFNEAVSFVVDCDTQEEIDYYWNKLTEGGAESMCGWLKDKFGVWWQIVPTVLGRLMSDAEKAPRVVQAFMQMKKFDIQKLLNA